MSNETSPKFSIGSVVFIPRTLEWMEVVGVKQSDTGFIYTLQTQPGKYEEPEGELRLAK